MDKNVIGLGSLTGSGIDFAWIGDNGAAGQYQDFTSWPLLRQHLDTRGYPSVSVEWHGDDFAVIAPAPSPVWQPVG